MSKGELHEKGETENLMVAEATRLAADTGIRKFWRENPMLRLHLTQTVEYLRAKSRGGDLAALNDLEAIQKQNETLKKIKQNFFATNSIGEKKSIAETYKIEEARMMKLLGAEE